MDYGRQIAKEIAFFVALAALAVALGYGDSPGLWWLPFLLYGWRAELVTEKPFKIRDDELIAWLEGDRAS